MTPDIAKRLDHRVEQTAIRNQGDRPTCVGFAISAAHEWMSSSDDIMSPEDVIWAGHQEGGPPNEEATSVQLALQGLKRFAHATEDAWPYNDPAWPDDRPAEALLADGRCSLPAWRRTAPDFDVVVGELAYGYAVILTLGFVPAVWYRTGGIIDAGSGRTTRGAHAVVAVGALQVTNDRRLIIKNSWGELWGDHGYGFVSESYLHNYGLAAHILERG